MSLFVIVFICRPAISCIVNETLPGFRSAKEIAAFEVEGLGNTDNEFVLVALYNSFATFVTVIEGVPEQGTEFMFPSLYEFNVAANSSI